MTTTKILDPTQLAYIDTVIAHMAYLRRVPQPGPTIGDRVTIKQPDGTFLTDDAIINVIANRDTLFRYSIYAMTQEMARPQVTILDHGTLTLEFGKNIVPRHTAITTVDWILNQSILLGDCTQTFTMPDFIHPGETITYTCPAHHWQYHSRMVI